MTTQEAIDHFGSAAALARALGITRGAVGQWEEHPPEGRQFQLELLTDGKLKASRQEQDGAAA